MLWQKGPRQSRMTHAAPFALVVRGLECAPAFALVVRVHLCVSVCSWCARGVLVVCSWCARGVIVV